MPNSRLVVDYFLLVDYRLVDGSLTYFDLETPVRLSATLTLEAVLVGDSGLRARSVYQV